MSLKNGDRSRANRLRKQRDRLRLKTRELSATASNKTAKTKPAK